MRAVRLLSAALLITAVLVAVGGANEAANAADAKDLHFGYTHVIKNEEVFASGTLSTHAARTVKLQYKSDGHWKTTQAVTSAGNGHFSFLVTVTKSRSYRYYAPKVAGTFGSITGHTTTVKVVSQSASVFATPNPACTGDTVNIVATLSPARPGRSVRLTLNGDDADTKLEDGHGHVLWSVPAGSVTGTYSLKVKALASDGASGKSSPTSSVTVQTCIAIG